MNILIGFKIHIYTIKSIIQFLWGAKTSGFNYCITVKLPNVHKICKVLETIVGGVSWNRAICLVTGKEHTPPHFNAKSHSSIHTARQELRTGNRGISCQGNYSENEKVNSVAQGKQLKVAEVNYICFYQNSVSIARLSKTTENINN